MSTPLPQTEESNLEPVDIFCLSAATGWLDLGRPDEARNELNGLRPAARLHPDTLEVYWMIHAAECDWDKALDTAHQLVQVAPERSTGWLHQAYAMRRSSKGGLKAARAVLAPAVVQFPEEPTIPYNLACYACQLNLLDEARHWLEAALKIGDKKRIKAMALADNDLALLWPQIKRM